MEVMSLLLERSTLFPMLWISTFSEKVCYQLSLLSIFDLFHSHTFFSSASKHVLVTPILKKKNPISGPQIFFVALLFSSLPILTQTVSGYSLALLTYSLASSNGFLPYFSIKTIFIKVSSDLHASNSHGHSSGFILCDLSVDFNKVDPSFFWGKIPVFLVSRLLHSSGFSLTSLPVFPLFLCHIFLFCLTFKCWNYSGSTLDSLLFSLYALPKSSYSLSWPCLYAESSQIFMTAQTFLQYPEPLNYLLNTSAWMPQTHLFRTKPMAFPTMLEVLYFPLHIHSSLTWLTISTAFLACGFQLGLATEDPWQETGNRG